MASGKQGLQVGGGHVGAAFGAPQLLDPQRMAVAAEGNDTIIVYVQTSAQSAGWGRRTPRPCGGNHQVLSAQFSERTRVGRRDGADQVIDLLCGLAPVDAAVLGTAAAEV